MTLRKTQQGHLDAILAGHAPATSERVIANYSPLGQIGSKSSKENLLGVSAILFALTGEKVELVEVKKSAAHRGTRAGDVSGCLLRRDDQKGSELRGKISHALGTLEAEGFKGYSRTLRWDPAKSMPFPELLPAMFYADAIHGVLEREFTLADQGGDRRYRLQEGKLL